MYAKFREGFESAMDPDFHRIEELDAKVADGSAIIWHTDNSAIACEIQRYPNALAIHGLCATGELREIVEDLIPQAEAWAKAAGCTHATIESREGWSRVLKARGYSPHTVTLGKVL
jgi:hypothetical protein